MHSTKVAFRIGYHVSWNSEAGRVRGLIKKKLTAPTKFKGYTVRASQQKRQYLIESAEPTTSQCKGSSLRKLWPLGSDLAVRKPTAG
jgi:hypothetical protein